MNVTVVEGELAAAETLDRYVSNVLAGRNAVLPAGVDAGEISAYLVAADLVVDRRPSMVSTCDTTLRATASQLLRH